LGMLLGVRKKPRNRENRKKIIEITES
jgi:hypothetical protein